MGGETVTSPSGIHVQLEESLPGSFSEAKGGGTAPPKTSRLLSQDSAFRPVHYIPVMLLFPFSVANNGGG